MYRLISIGQLDELQFQRKQVNLVCPVKYKFKNFYLRCGHCKNLAPAWADAATQLKGKVKLGALDATKETIKASEYGVRGYPTIKWFPGGVKSASDVKEYEGGRSASDIVNFALDKFKANMPPPELIQITTQASVDKACGGNQLCVVAVLPHILDCQAECR